MLPSRVQKNQPITADLLNNIIDSIRECQLQSGAGYSFSRSGGGTTLSISIPKAGQPAVAEACPFDVSTIVSGSELKIKVNVGTLNALVATNYADCLLFDSTPLSTSITGSTNVVLDITTDGQQVTSFELGLENTISAVTPSTPLAPTSFKWPVAHIKNGIAYKTIGCGNLIALVRENVRLSKSPATPSDNAYDIYYYWVVSTAII